MRQARRRYAPLRLSRLLTLATDCRLAQDILSLINDVLRRYRPCRAIGVILPHTFGGEVAFTGGGVLCRVAIAFAASPVTCSRGGPPPGFSSSHSPDTLCSNLPSLLS